MLTGGCATIEARDRTIRLHDQARVYINAMRWTSFETAAPLFRNRDGSLPELNLEQYQGIRVTWVKRCAGCAALRP
ncbi:MAG: hypothetical protein GKR94_32765 [Gammaproteobacteria bacterium]|nr:hypothetical protein [Gammaproteobacteria bacterium]